ncbi:probable G-protein coupled receptor 139 [Heptranchias perlo]|uniref:probable G-protein coupled receptor 139 n=1 Tax=Heptranchias perlo TaxID=212740 RepID=UPI00355A2D76
MAASAAAILDKMAERMATSLHKTAAINLVAIVILSRGKCSLSKCISVYLVGMAVADLMVVIISVILKWIGMIYFRGSFLHITPVCSCITSLNAAVTVVSVWFTVAFTFDRFVAICCEKLKNEYCTERTAAVVLGTVSVLGCLQSVPWYFTLNPVYIVDNVPWFCETKPSFRTSPALAAYDMYHLILTPCVPFCLILLLNVLTVRRILVSSRVRRALRARSNGENQSDPEMENRKKSIILLFSISGSFILLWLTQVVFYIYVRIADIQYYYSFSDPVYITQQTATMLQLLSSCTNTCIYVLTQNKFRKELKNAIHHGCSNLTFRFLTAPPHLESSRLLTNSQLDASMQVYSLPMKLMTWLQEKVRYTTTLSIKIPGIFPASLRQP